MSQMNSQVAKLQEFNLIGLEEKTEEELYDIARRINEWKSETAKRSDYAGFKAATDLQTIVSKEFKERRLLWP